MASTVVKMSQGAFFRASDHDKYREIIPININELVVLHLLLNIKSSTVIRSCSFVTKRLTFCVRFKIYPQINIR